MEIEKNLNGECNLIGISSQKKGRFIIQELEEENNKVFFSTKKYSFDAKRIIFSYNTYENSALQTQTDNNYFNDKVKSSNDLSSNEKRNRLDSLDSKRECFCFSEASYNNDTSNYYKKENLEKRKISEDNYILAEKKSNNDTNTLIQIKTYVLSMEEDNYQFLDFDKIWKQFIKLNKINLHDELDNIIFSYKNSSPEIIILKASKKPSSIFSSEQSSQQGPETQIKHNLSDKIKMQISNSSIKKFNRYNSEIKLLSNKKDENYKFPLWSQNLESIKKRTFSGERISIFKRNSINSICSSFYKKMIYFNNNHNNQSSQHISSNMKYPYLNNKTANLHSNFKSDLEINYGLHGLQGKEETLINIKRNDSKIFSLKRLSKTDIIQRIPVINKTESESFKAKMLNNFLIKTPKSKQNNCEVNIDFISSGKNSDSKLNTVIKYNEQVLNKKESKSNLIQFEYETSNLENDNLNKENYFCSNYNNYNYNENVEKGNKSDEDYDNQEDILFKFHSHGLNIQNNKRIYIEDNLNEKVFKANFEKDITKQSNNNILNKCKCEEQDYDLIPKVNFDSDKNFVSDFNPFISKHDCNYYYHNKKDYCNVNYAQENNCQEKGFEMELNEINQLNERNAKKKNSANTKENLEDLLRSPFDVLYVKDNKPKNSKNTNSPDSIKNQCKSWNLNLEVKSIENSNHYSFKKQFYLQNAELENKIDNEKNNALINNNNINANKQLDIFALEEEEDHFYYSCSSINTPKSKALEKNKQLIKLSDPLKLRVKPYVNETDKNQISNKNNKTEKSNKKQIAYKKNKHVIKQTSSKKFLNILPEYELNDRLNKNKLDFNKKFKNQSIGKLNIIKSIQKSFVEDEKQKIGVLMSRINSADRKFNCVNLNKTMIENTQFEILPCPKDSNNEDNKEEEIEESEEILDSYAILQVMQVISIELLGKKKKKNDKKEAENHLCIDCCGK